MALGILGASEQINESEKLKDLL
ncbi:MAG TPA: hypothetical protein PKI98_10765 [Chitinophagaceae bacterium]|nr:hypothetical protein [Chitinophagaceae bacterium]